MKFTNASFKAGGIMLCACLFPVLAIAQTQQFTTPGTHGFTVPSSVISMKIECVGAGGAGGRVTPSNAFDYDASGGGGGGAYASSVIDVIADSTYQLVVGAGGVNNGTSINGGHSYFGDGTQVLAEGGLTRSGNDNESGVAGGQAGNSIGTIKYSGGNGGNGDEGDANGGGGGGAAGSNGNGHDGGTTSGGGSQLNYGGNGGDGGFDGDHGDAGGNYGGGGGGSSAQGSSNRDGGAGAGGLVVITWCEISGFAPDTVCSTGGETIIINGSNFTGVDSVWVNGMAVPFTVISAAEIHLTLPAGISSGRIVVQSANGRSGSLTNLQVISNTVSVNVNGLQLTAQYSGGSSATYQWIDCINGNTPIPGATSPVYTATQNGLYAVIVSEGGCQVTSSCATINNVGIESHQDEAGWFLYPNPVSSVLNIVNSSETIRQVRIFDLTGKVVHEFSANASASQADISFLPEGVYVVAVYSDKTTIIRRIIVSK